MSGNRLFLDTNIILYLFQGDETVANLLQDKQIFISIITELELLGFENISENEQKIIEEFIDTCTVISINQTVKKKTIAIRKQYKTKLPDSIIIATALYLDLPLITGDSDFKKVKELTLIHYQK